ncbi:MULTISPECIES: NADH-quinone oxidoreductase subunit NuoK [unclassified Mucilaginibacter]|uniref:NADH-quinone oxidoreductase subunit NuoK n=1 Tax=unclassified Mucilaginibacter TaxID=2617802 RepID=UPI00138BFBD4|nr:MULTISPECIES: NADH-quinone oxidoreductase subunit NuoK [unclassified Mucilaginibacter]MBB5395589.1 NADH-quinone oxidoreductase subunit K [Mucilaginibacter sp. AK015]QHS56110.1 NADH-quinone oxidoreductase subunit NuoK [Mucilaginibacter sp. 14171R-50]
MINLSDFMIVSVVLFCTGLFIIVSKKNTIQILIGIELMLNAAILNLVAFGKYDRTNNGGQMFALFAIVLAAATTAVALAIILNVYRRYKTIDPDRINQLKDQ